MTFVNSSSLFFSEEIVAMKIENFDIFSEIQLNNFDTNVTINIKINNISYGHELLWMAHTTGTNYEESAVTYADGIAYIGSCSTHGDGYDMLFAVNTSSGDIIWSKFTGPGYVGPVIDGDMVYLGTSSHGYFPNNEFLIAFNRFTGEEIWRIKIYGGIAESIQYDDSQLYFCSDKAYAVNKIDGSINWTYNIESYCVTKPLLKDNFYYTATSGGKMYKLNCSDGSLIWKITLSDFSWDNSITSDNMSHIFLTLYGDSTINSYSENDGSLIWSYKLHAQSLSFNAYHNGVIFISDTMGFVYALNSDTGELIWENRIAGNFDISSPTASGGLIFIGSRDFEDSAFFVLDEFSGDVLWKYDLDYSVTAPPSIADGMMLCGTDGWYTYCFDFGLGDDDWLLHRYDSYNTAFSPGGLTHWQYVSCESYFSNEILVCNITNFYDHDVFNVVLNLGDDFSGYWYDSFGNTISYNSNTCRVETIKAGSNLFLYISEVPVSAPLKPDVPLGPDSGRTGNEYIFSGVCIDPDGDDLYYLWDWGDGNFSDWIGPYGSGDMINFSYKWNDRGVFEVRLKARDIYGLESVWSDPLVVSMPKNFLFLNNLIEKNYFLYKILN